MRRLLKRLGPTVGALLVLNEVRGLIVVVFIVNGWSHADPAQHLAPRLAKVIACSAALDC